MAGDSGKVARPAVKKAAAAPVETSKAVDVAATAPVADPANQTPPASDLLPLFVVTFTTEGHAEPVSTLVRSVDELSALSEADVPVGAEVTEVRLATADEEPHEPAPGAVTPGAGDLTGNVPPVPADVDTDPGLNLEALARLANGAPDEVTAAPTAEAAPAYLSGSEVILNEDGDRYLVLGAIFACWIDGNYRTASKGDIVVVDPKHAAKALSKGFLAEQVDELDYES